MEQATKDYLGCFDEENDDQSSLSCSDSDDDDYPV